MNTVLYLATFVAATVFLGLNLKAAARPGASATSSVTSYADEASGTVNSALGAVASIGLMLMSFASAIGAADVPVLFLVLVGAAAAMGVPLASTGPTSLPNPQTPQTPRTDNAAAGPVTR